MNKDQPATGIRQAILKHRRKGESRNAHAKRISVPEPTLRMAEKRNRLPTGAAGVLLSRVLKVRQ